MERRNTISQRDGDRDGETEHVVDCGERNNLYSTKWGKLNIKTLHAERQKGFCFVFVFCLFCYIRNAKRFCLFVCLFGSFCLGFGNRDQVVYGNDKEKERERERERER